MEPTCKMLQIVLIVELKHKKHEIIILNAIVFK